MGCRITAADAAAKNAAQGKNLCRSLQVSDPAPWFVQNSTSNPHFHFETAAGRYVVLCFYGTGSDEIGPAALEAFQDKHRSLFDDDRIAVFGVGSDPSDLSEGRARQIIPGVRHFWDFDGAVGRLYGALPHSVEPGQRQVPARRFWLVLNPTLRVRTIFPFNNNDSGHDEVAAYLQALPRVDRFAGFEIPAPIIIVPDIFEPALCRHLIGLYEQNGGQEYGPPALRLPAIPL